MKRYLLDTSVLVGYFNGRPGAVALIQPWLTNREVATGILVLAEAIERTLTIVTTDEDFRRVPNLSIMLLDRRMLGVRP